MICLGTLPLKALRCQRGISDLKRARRALLPPTHHASDRDRSDADHEARTSLVQNWIAIGEGARVYRLWGGIARVLSKPGVTGSFQNAVAAVNAPDWVR